jgi:alcohol dehydrogenase (cytochrome c)
MRYALLVLAVSSAFGSDVTYDRIRRAASEPQNWLTYSGSYSGQRYSPLAQITRDNVAELRPLWVYQMWEAGKVETTPLAVDGVLYFTETPYVVTALDAKTGRPLWYYRRKVEENVPICCGQVNRGLAILGDTLYLGSLDAHLVALSAQTGAVRWDVQVEDYRTGHSITAAPLVVKDKVIVGISGGDFGIRGFLDAYDAKTGKRLWRRWTVPGVGEPGHETWGPGESWKSGGAPTWVTGTYDPELNLLYWGTGNPAPDYNGDTRPGDNLYSDCLLALDPDTGSIRWHFQFTPHDVHDWDSNQIPVLIDAMWEGRMRMLVVQANRNAFFYVLDRETGEYLHGEAFAGQSWARGLDPRGRPILKENCEPSVEGTRVAPGFKGGTTWFSPTYSPLTGLFYVQAHEDYANIFYKMKQDYEPGVQFDSGSTKEVLGIEPSGAVKALDLATGKPLWQFKLKSPASGGLLSTAGGLVFGGTSEGHFFALDAATGADLWHFQTGGFVTANPISFEVENTQCIGIAAGKAIFVFAIERKH